MKNTLILLAVVLFAFSCRKEEAGNFDGPDLTDVYGEFKVLTVLTASDTVVDFSAGQSVHFNCELTKLSDWKLTITGLTSGAQKIIMGASRTLDETTALWDGSTTEFPVFREEECAVQLTFDGEVDTLTSSVTITGRKVNKGFVVADFETGWNNGWFTFIQSGANMDFSIKSDSISPEFDHYYNMQGEVNWDWLVGLIDFKASAYGEDVLPLSSNGDNLYFNALVYGEKGLPNSLVLFRFDEDDNEDGYFTETAEDQYSYEVAVDWEGWKLISIKYSDMLGSGNGGDIHNPNKLNKVSVLHLANPESGFAKSGLDLMIFTENGPLAP